MADQLFSTEQEQQQTPAQITPSSDPFADQLKGILNEQGLPKYKSTSDALNGLANAQPFIQQLKNEKAQLAEELARLKAEAEQRASLEDVISKLSTQKAPEDRPPQEALASGDIEAIVANALEKKHQQQRAVENLEAVQSQLVARFGDKAKAVIAEKAAELGLSVEQIGAMAQQSPKAVLAFFGASGGKSPNLSTSSVNTSNLYAPKGESGLEPPKKSLLSGVSNKEVIEYNRKIKEYIYKKFNVEV